MSNRKGQNSIIFLTTLGVYLGLALVGAAPSIMAQAALTQKLEIVSPKAEEDKDCWDDAPHEVTDLLNSGFVVGGVLDFIHDLQRLSGIGKYDFGDRFDFKFDYRATEGGIARTDYPNSFSNEWLRVAASERIEQLGSNSYYRYDQELKTNASHSTVRFSSENGILEVTISLERATDKDAFALAKLYNDTFAVGTCTSVLSVKEKVLYQNSKSSAENNQVFIVTRLPRAGLDSLLATDAK